MKCEEFWSTFPELDAGSEGNIHLEDCPACRARIRRHAELHAGLRTLAAGYRRMETPGRVENRLRTAFRREMGHEMPVVRRRWIPVLTWAAAFALMFALGVFLVKPRRMEAVRPAPQRTVELAVLQPRQDAEGFIPLPNTPGVAADEDDVNLVRVAVPRSTMIALGFDVSTDR